MSFRTGQAVKPVALPTLPDYCGAQVIKEISSGAGSTFEASYTLTVGDEERGSTPEDAFAQLNGSSL